jgi:hypothetical protein
VDRRVAQAVCTQGFDVLGGHLRRLMGDLHGEVAERAHPRFEVGAAIVVRGMLGELVGGALGTEVVGVRANSVVTVVRARDDDGEQLPLDP